ncbi:MAG: addiction module protein [Fluviicola sp.]|nr:addiction module protein [Fluviicola sp.]
MSLQFISDSKGKTTGVFIPIKDWDKLKSKYQGIEQEGIEIPEWQMKEVERRLEDFKNNPDSASDFDQAMDEIEKDL